MTRLLILGGGELGCQICHWATITGKFEIAGFADDNIAIGELCKGYPVLGTMADVPRLYAEGRFDEAFIGIGYMHFDNRRDAYQLLTDNGIPLATIIGPMVYVDPTARIGKGVILYPGSIIDKEVVIEDNVVVNIHSNVGHNSVVKRHTFISGSVSVAGYTEIGESCFLGSNCTVTNNLKVTDNVVIGSGSLIRHDIEEPGVYAGRGEKLR